MKLRLIINADDLGFDCDINNAIFALMAERIVTSATIIANGAGFEEAVERIPHQNGCSFGVHLYLTDFAPISTNRAFKVLLDDEGNFGRDIWQTALTAPLRQAIFQEWCAQIDKIRSYGIRISHIDSHRHVHTIPSLFLILKKVQKRYSIGKVRNTINLPIHAVPISLQLRMKKLLWNFALKHYYTTLTTTWFTKFDAFLSRAQAGESFSGTAELMVHPGNPAYSQENQALRQLDLGQFPMQVELISYDDL